MQGIQAKTTLGNRTEAQVLSAVHREQQKLSTLTFRYITTYSGACWIIQSKLIELQWNRLHAHVITTCGGLELNEQREKHCGYSGNNMEITWKEKNMINACLAVSFH